MNTITIARWNELDERAREALLSRPAVRDDARISLPGDGHFGAVEGRGKAGR